MRTIVFALALLLLSGHSIAENSCIRTGGSDVILTEVADCTAGFAAFHRDVGWKFAYVDDTEVNLGCWRTDGTFVYVQLDGQTTIHLASNVVSAKFCPRPEVFVRDERWESAIEDCEDLNSPKRTARLACDVAMKLAESFDEADPRFVRALEGFSLYLEDLAEKEILLHRVLDIYKKHFSADYVMRVSAIAAFGHLHQERNAWQESIPFYQDAIALGRKHLGNENLEVVVITMLFGKLYLDHGKLTEVKELLLQALAGAENNQSSHWNMASHAASLCARFLADVYRAEGDIAEADRYAEKQRKSIQSPRSNEKVSGEVERGEAEES
jgi:hypothetical protein